MSTDSTTKRAMPALIGYLLAAIWVAQAAAALYVVVTRPDQAAAAMEALAGLATRAACAAPAAPE